jgi:hypothetical protein
MGTDVTASDDRREKVARALRGQGLTDRPDQYDSDIHSWRCKHPDIYGPCSCFEELVDAALAAVAPDCTCPYTPSEMWLSAASCGYGSGYEPGSMQEWDPDCPAHPRTEVWDACVAPGGYVCGACGMPTESEPCREHGQRGPR